MSMRINPNTLHWFRESKLYILSADKLILETEPHSSLNTLIAEENSAFGLYANERENFSFDVKIDFGFRSAEDECGLILKRTDDDWCKFGITAKNEEVNEVFCKRYLNGYWDNSMRVIGKNINSVYFRMLYWDGRANFQCSTSGNRFRNLRMIEFGDGKEASPGIYACSPRNSYFDCTFSKMEMSE